MIYKILEIREDVDFGCEERNEDQPFLCEAVLEDTDGAKRCFKMADALFEKRDLREGDQVYIDEDDTLQKAITSTDWTKEFSGKDVDVRGFLKNLEDLAAGKKKNWICPFCGGHVLLLKNEHGSWHIGCDGCDMTIDLDAITIK